MGEAVLAHMVDEPRGQLRVGEEPAVLLGYPSPRTEMHLVDRHRLVETLFLSAVAHPLAVEPFVAWLEDDRRRLRGLLGGERERVGLVELAATQS